MEKKIFNNMLALKESKSWTRFIRQSRFVHNVFDRLDAIPYEGDKQLHKTRGMLLL